MSGERDPIRLLDPESGASHALREVLGSAGDDAPTEADLRRLGARVAALGESPSPGGGGGSSPILPASLIAVGIATLVGGLVFWSWPPPRDPPTLPARPPSADSLPAAGPALAPSAVEPPTPSPATMGVAPHPPPADESNETNPHVPRGPLPAAVADGTAETSTEIQLLGEAQRLLRAGVPRRALELTQEHAASFSAGMLVEEREAIAVEALARLGRGGEAAVRYASFVRRFPRSTYRARLEKLVAR